MLPPGAGLDSVGELERFDRAAPKRLIYDREPYETDSSLR
jgi:hypothetical protein